MRYLATKQRGFTLTELMVGIFVSLLIVAGTLETILHIKFSDQFQKDIATMHENARYTSFILTKNIRRGGYLDCFSNQTPNNLVNAASQFNGAGNYNQGIIGFNANGSSWTPSLSNYFANAGVKASTDAIAIQYLSNPHANLVQTMLSTDSDIEINKTITPQVGDLLIISDCEKADIFRASSVASNTNDSIIRYTDTYNLPPPSNTSTDNSPLSKAYGTNAQVSFFITHTYFIANNAAGKPALWQYTINPGGNLQQRELINGVEDLQLLYGQDTDDDGSVNVYVDSSGVTDWNSVLSIKAYFLLYSEHRIVTGTNTYTFMGTTKTATDGILRKQFVTTIKLRNKGTI